MFNNKKTEHSNQARLLLVNILQRSLGLKGECLKKFNIEVLLKIVLVLIVYFECVWGGGTRSHSQLPHMFSKDPLASLLISSFLIEFCRHIKCITSGCLITNTNTQQQNHQKSLFKNYNELLVWTTKLFSCICDITTCKSRLWKF